MDINFILRRTIDIITTADEKAKWSTQPRIILGNGRVIQLAKLGVKKKLSQSRVKRLQMGLRIRKYRAKKVKSQGHKM